jgi:glutathione S-transferase
MADKDPGKWVPLRHYLRLKRGRNQELALSFRQIEDVLGDGLPKPARKYPEWWHNDAANEQARAWLESGWRVREADLAAERVVFEPNLEDGPAE